MSTGTGGVPQNSWGSVPTLQPANRSRGERKVFGCQPVQILQCTFAHDRCSCAPLSAPIATNCPRHPRCSTNSIRERNLIHLADLIVSKKDTMLKAAPRAFKWKLPSAPAVCQKRLLFSQSVLRSPLDRSRIPRSIQRLRLQREQEQPAEDPKQTLYPDAIYSPDGSYSGGLIHNSDAVAELLSRPSLVIQRNIEFMNLFLGFEQANRYNILSTEGEFLGRIEEEDYSILKMIMRQVYRLHRPFLTRVYDREDRHILTIQRPFSFINSRIKAILPGVSSEGEGVIVGETRQQWHLWRRKYNLFLSDTTVPPGEEPVFNQFGACDAPFLSFAFPIENEEGKVIAQVDRNWVGLAREFFTDTGVYVLRMEPSALQDTVAPEWIGDGLSLDERVVLLANAISIDFDYFSRHSRGGGGWFSVGDWE